MNKEFKRPKILISKCIEFDSCRYNSQMISSDFVKKIKKFVDFYIICPEVEISLGVPRDPIRIVEKNSEKRLMQPKTKKDLTKDMKEFIELYLKEKEIDGAILKSKSPSCGIREVKIYPNIEKSAPLRRGKGFFGEAVLNRYKLYPIENEDRLRNRIIKENFLKRIFTIADFRKIKEKKSLNSLIDFHSKNKFLLMSYSQKYLNKLGNILANKEKMPIEDMINIYEENLLNALSVSPICAPNTNVLMHSFGFISKKLKKDEKELFLKSLDNYKKGHVGLSVPISIMKSWVVRFDESYLKMQSFFAPYPDDLVEVENINFCDARDFWK